MDWWEERDRERSEEYAKGKVIVQGVKDEHERQVCERLDKRKAGLLPPLVLEAVRDGKEIWVEAVGWKPPRGVRRRKV